MRKYRTSFVFIVINLFWASMAFGFNDILESSPLEEPRIEALLLGFNDESFLSANVKELKEIPRVITRLLEDPIPSLSSRQGYSLTKEQVELGIRGLVYLLTYAFAPFSSDPLFHPSLQKLLNLTPGIMLIFEQKMLTKHPYMLTSQNKKEAHELLSETLERLKEAKKEASNLQNAHNDQLLFDSLRVMESITSALFALRMLERFHEASLKRSLPAFRLFEQKIFLGGVMCLILVSKLLISVSALPSHFEER
jgi:hypothetical protein